MRASDLWLGSQAGYVRHPWWHALAPDGPERVRESTGHSRFHGPGRGPGPRRWFSGAGLTAVTGGRLAASGTCSTEPGRSSTSCLVIGGRHHVRQAAKHTRCCRHQPTISRRPARLRAGLPVHVGAQRACRAVVAASARPHRRGRWRSGGRAGRPPGARRGAACPACRRRPRWTSSRTSMVGRLPSSSSTSGADRIASRSPERRRRELA